MPARDDFVPLAGSKRIIAPSFCVTSILPSGRNAIDQGDSKVATVVTVKGRLAGRVGSWAWIGAPPKITASEKRVRRCRVPADEGLRHRITGSDRSDISL